MATIKVNACYTVKSYKNKLENKFQTGGRAPGAPVLDPPLVRIIELYTCIKCNQRLLHEFKSYVIFVFP